MGTATYTSSYDTEYTVDYSLTTDGHRWAAIHEGTEIAFLLVQADDAVHEGIVFTAGQIIQIETEDAFQREGIATQLYRIADAQIPGGIIHSAPEHRTAEGDAFANAVGGETL